MEFELWLEFEQFEDDSWDKANELTNASVTLSTGKTYHLNIWSYSILNRCVELDKRTKENLAGKYQIPPDLLVEEISRCCIQESIQDILSKGKLEDYLNRIVD